MTKKKNPKPAKRGNASRRAKGRSSAAKQSKRKVAAKQSKRKIPTAKPQVSTSNAPARKPPASVALFPSSLALYVYGVTEVPTRPFTVTSEAVDGRGIVEPFAEGDYLCWASRVSRQEYAEDLQKNMENLEWLAACSIRHQKVLSELGAVTQVLPARFGTVFLTPQSMLSDLAQKTPQLRGIFDRIAEADEWGVKVFGVAHSRSAVAVSASSGAEYLRKKASALQEQGGERRDPALQAFGDQLAECSVASVPGGKASSSQPGLLWNGSFLVKRGQKKQFDAVLKRYAAEWAPDRRIDVSGPWPPYSFVSEE